VKAVVSDEEGYEDAFEEEEVIDSVGSEIIEDYYV
jgi:hypothetical protein